MDREWHLLDIARKMIGRSDIELETRRDEVEEWDSLAHVMIIAAIKEQLGITIPIEQSEKIIKVKDFSRYE